MIRQAVDTEENRKLPSPYGNYIPDEDGIIHVIVLDDSDEDNDYWYNKYYKIQTVEVSSSKSYLIIGFENTQELFAIKEFDSKESALQYFEDEREKLYESLGDAGDGRYVIDSEGVVSCECEPTADVLREKGSLEDGLTITITRLRDEYYDEVHYFTLI